MEPARTICYIRYASKLQSSGKPDQVTTLYDFAFYSAMHYCDVIMVYCILFRQHFPEKTLTGLCFMSYKLYGLYMAKQSSFFCDLTVSMNFLFFQFHHYQNSHYQLPFDKNNNFLSRHSHVDKLSSVLVVSFAASLFWF